MQTDPSKSDNRQAWQQWVRHIITQKKYYILVSVVILAVFLTGVLYGIRRGGQSGSADGRRILYYVDPMNPAHTSPEPGLAPCGMKMEPVYADSPGGELPPPFLPPGSVRITPQKQQLIGVRVGEVERAPFTHTLRALARVAVDETRIYRLNSFADGWIQTVRHNPTGSLVMKHEVLASYNNPQILFEVPFYLATLAQTDRILKSDRQQFITQEVRLRKSQANLKELGMDEIQIQELAKTQEVAKEIYLYAPVTSFVLARNVSPGQRITKGEELYRLADLSRVWIVADLYEREVDFVKPGMQVRATLPHRNLDLWATVTDILPEYDKASRTMKVRLEADNPDYALRPDIFMDVEFPVQLPAAVTVPMDAIIYSGLKKTVFVERGNGYFEPRRVETGWRFGDRVEITKGLEPGERIVISGNFLVDSESRMKLAAAGFVGEVARDPVIGVNVDESKARVTGLQSQYKNRTYSFHSEETKLQFDQNPERYLEMEAKRLVVGRALHQEKPGPALAKCPVCALEVDEALAKAKGLISEHQGKTYYFCRYYCNREFDKSSERYIKEAAACCPHGGEKERESPLIVKDPVCGLEVNREEAGAQRLKRGYKGQDYYFCRDYCVQQFDKSPERYAPSLAPHHAPTPGQPETVTSTVPGVKGALEQSAAIQAAPTRARDPVCGMEVDSTDANPQKTHYQGKFYYFCSDRCKEQFDLGPVGYINQSPATPAPDATPQAPPTAQPAPEPPKPQSGKNTSVPVPPASSKGKAGESADLVCNQCGMPIKRDPKARVDQLLYHGKNYSFCSINCKRNFYESLKERSTAGTASSSPQRQMTPPAERQRRIPDPRATRRPPAVPPAGPPTAPYPWLYQYD